MPGFAQLLSLWHSPAYPLMLKLLVIYFQLIFQQKTQYLQFYYSSITKTYDDSVWISREAYN